MNASDPREFGVGMLGYGFTGKAHSNAYRKMCAFNYRFVPAVRLARQLVDAGEIGDVLHFRGRYLQEWGVDPTLDAWRFRAEEAGGMLGDTGAHERLSELRVFRAGARGFETVLVTEPDNPFLEWWWPPGHILG